MLLVVLSVGFGSLLHPANANKKTHAKRTHNVLCSAFFVLVFMAFVSVVIIKYRNLSCAPSYLLPRVIQVRALRPHCCGSSAKINTTSCLVVSWSNRRGSNPHLRLGKPPYCRYTTIANLLYQNKLVLSRAKRKSTVPDAHTPRRGPVFQRSNCCCRGTDSNASTVMAGTLYREKEGKPISYFGLARAASSQNFKLA